MIDPTLYIARLGLARDQLAEARRYVRTQPQAARKILADVTYVFQDMLNENERFLLPAVHRCLENIYTIRSAVGVDPDASCGGIDLMRHELAYLAGNLRREWERGDRDRELTEAYGPR